jgi:starch synthase (maltosyl-transferring)
VDNDMLIAYSKSDQQAGDAVLAVVNLDPHYTQSGWIELDTEALGIDPSFPMQLVDLLGGDTYIWSGARNYVELRPGDCPAHVFHLRRHLRTEHDFEYFA